MLALALAVLVLAVLLFVLAPLLRGVPPEPGNAAFDRAVYRDQLRELDRDQARGVLTDAEAQSARLEIQRRLLAVPDAPAGRSGRGVGLAVVIALLAAGISAGLYDRLGAPAVHDLPFASRQVQPGATVPGAPEGASPGEAPDVAAAVVSLEAELRANPSNLKAWVAYARALSALDEWEKAAAAYDRAVALGAGGAEVLSGQGEVIAMRAGGIVTEAAAAAFNAALRDNPKNEVARYYLGLAAAQAGDTSKAAAIWRGLLADLPAGSGAREEVSRRLAEIGAKPGEPGPVGTAAPGPNADTVEAASRLPEAERKAMIEGMVARLATRLEQQPDDAEGWRRLGRAYGVMGAAEKSADAYERAAALRPADVSLRLLAMDALLVSYRIGDPFPPRALAMLTQIEAIAPDEPTMLWYRGLAEASARRGAEARRYWERLLAKLPPGSESAGAVKAALQALDGK